MGSRAKEVLARWPFFELCVAAAALALFLGVAPFGGFDTIVGDNIAQVGYWRVLFNRQFVGSLGASSMKPGLIVLLGAVHDLSTAIFHSTVLVQVVLAGAAALLVTIVGRIAKEAGGLLAGLGAVVYLVTQTEVPRIYTQGSSMIVFLPLLASGLWAFTRQRQRTGAILLCLAALVRIEAFSVLLWVALAEQLLRRRFREFLVTSVLVGMTVAFTVTCYYLVQGSIARFNAGGPGVGYVVPGTSTVWERSVHAVSYLGSATYENAVARSGHPCLAIPALIGLLLHPARRVFLAILGIPAFLMIYIITGEGHPESRYFEFLLPFIAALGASGVAYACREVPRAWLVSRKAWGVAALLLGVFPLLYYVGEWKVLGSFVLVVGALGLGALSMHFGARSLFLRATQGVVGVVLASILLVGVQDMTQARAKPRARYTRDAIRFIKQETVPRGARVLIDDDLIYGILVRDPGYLAAASALQNFAVQEDARREEMLASTDYIVISKGRHSWNFLRYDPIGRGNKDPFRALVRRISRTSKPATIYGHRLIPMQNSRRWLVLKVEPA